MIRRDCCSHPVPMCVLLFCGCGRRSGRRRFFGRLPAAFTIVTPSALISDGIPHYLVTFLSTHTICCSFGAPTGQRMPAGEPRGSEGEQDKAKGRETAPPPLTEPTPCTGSRPQLAIECRREDRILAALSKEDHFTTRTGRFAFCSTEKATDPSMPRITPMPRCPMTMQS